MQADDDTVSVSGASEAAEKPATPPPKGKCQLHGLVVKPAEDKQMTVLSGAVAVSAWLPERPSDIRPGSWVNFEMDLDTGENHIIAECAPRYKTYLFDDDSFSVLSPATYYLDENMDEEEESVAYTPYFRFVEDPQGLMQQVDWMEWYQVLLAPADDGMYLLRVERIVESMAGCIEDGALPGLTPTHAQIADAIESDAPRGEYKGVQILNSHQLGLCIGHVQYDRVEGPDGKFSGYASGRSGPSNNIRPGGYNNYNNQRGSRGGYGGGRGFDSQDWRRGGGGGWGDNRGGPSRADGDWRVAQRQEANEAPSRQDTRSVYSHVKKVVSSLIFTTRGIIMSKLEQERYEEGDWICFEKTAKSDYTVAREQKGKEPYPPYLLQHRVMPNGYGGETRVQGRPDEWKIQVKVLVEFGRLRERGWTDPSFFNKIECTQMMLRKATRELEKSKLGWKEMSEKEQDEVQIYVWIGLEITEMRQLPSITEFPGKYVWQVRELHLANFIHDLPLDMAKQAGALPIIVF